MCHAQLSCYLTFALNVVRCLGPVCKVQRSVSGLNTFNDWDLRIKIYNYWKVHSIFIDDILISMVPESHCHVFLWAVTSETVNNWGNSCCCFLCRRLFQPQQNLLTVPEAQVSPLRDTPNSSPAHQPKLAPAEDCTDSLTSRKPRISHLSSKTARDNLELKPSRHATLKDTEVKADDGRGNSLDPKRLLDSLSAVCQQEAVAAKRLKPTGSAQQGPKDPEEPPKTDSARPPSPLIVPDQSRHTVKKKKSKHREHVRKPLLL